MDRSTFIQPGGTATSLGDTARRHQGIAPGTHTLQVNGTSFEGNDRSASLGVVVTADAQPTPPLPATGGGSTWPPMVLAALAMLVLGALARRRT